MNRPGGNRALSHREFAAGMVKTAVGPARTPIGAAFVMAVGKGGEPADRDPARDLVRRPARRPWRRARPGLFRGGRIGLHDAGRDRSSASILASGRAGATRVDVRPDQGIMSRSTADLPELTWQSSPARTPCPALPMVRRFEGGRVRAWPAASTHYERHLGHPADGRTRLATAQLDQRRSTRATSNRKSAGAHGARQAPLRGPMAGPRLSGSPRWADPGWQSFLDQAGWDRVSESLVHAAQPRATRCWPVALAQIPLKEHGPLHHGGDRHRQPRSHLAPGGLSELISSIQPEAGLFVVGIRASPFPRPSVFMTARLAGLFENRDPRVPCAAKGNFARRAGGCRLSKWAHSRGASPGLAAGRGRQCRRHPSLRVARLQRALPLSLPASLRRNSA